MERTHDLILNMVANPTMSLGNLKTVGLTAENTALESEDKYLQSQKIQNMNMFKDETGNFSKSKFHDFYQNAQAAYNIMSSDQYTDELTKKSRTYHRDNIFAPLEQRRKGPDFSWVKQSNAMRDSQSLVRLGKTEDSPWTWDELAQREKVLANPVEATRADGTIDESKAIWQNAPNDSWFDHFFETRVAAQWDEDGEHIDPINGNKVKHSKGDLKTNSEGHFYYENLDGRDVYGRRVLNKMNTLTTDGSEWNKYDFFDSDGKDKSVGGTIMKNAALVGSMFIPYVGPAITFLSLANQTAGLMGTLGKMYANFSNDNFGTNIDTSTFSEMEGWAKSVNRQGAVSQHSQDNMWTVENMVGLIGDVMAQFKEQRFLFEKAPLIFKNKYGIVNNKNYNDKLTEVEGLYQKLNQTKMEDLIQSGKSYLDIQKGFKELKTIQQAKAISELDSYIKGYNKIGEILSKAYMTGITVGDTYGEAKLQGASDNEALWLTLGYGAGEAAILNTGIGEWLFPELRYEKLHQKAVAEALVKVKDETKKQASKMVSSSLKKGEDELKRNYVKRLFNIGKQTAEDLYTGYKSTGDKTIKAAFFNALGEGTEEVSEELLADFSKACFNGVGWLRGDDTRLEAFDNGDWEKILNRYSMNFIGGFIGGGAAGFSLENMRNIKKLDHMEFDQAMQELIYMSRNGQSKDFLKNLDKMTLGDKNLSATKFHKEGDSYIWEQGTETDNQDKAAKDAIRTQIKLFEDILSAEGIKMSDDSFLSKQTDILPDLKFALLKNSSTAGRYLQEFNSLSAGIIQANASLLAEKEKVTSEDNNKENNAQVDIEENQKQQIQQSIATLQQQLQTATGEEAENLKQQLKALQQQLGNQQNSGSRTQNIERRLKELRKQKEALLDGTRSAEFIQDALYEMTDAINNDFIKPSFIRYAEYKTKRDFDDIPDNEKGLLRQQWNNWGEMDRAQQVHESSEIFKNVLIKSMPLLQTSTEQYEALLQSQDVANLQQILEGWLNVYQDISKTRNVDGWIEKAADSLASIYQGVGLAFSDEMFADTLRRLTEDQTNLTTTLNQEKEQINKQIRDINLDESLDDLARQTQLATLNQQLKDLDDNYVQEMNKLHTQKEDLMTKQVASSIDQLITPYIEQGFANAEVKNALSQVINIADDYITEEMREYKRRKAELMNGGRLTDAEQHELDAINAYIDPRQETLNNLRQQKRDLNALSATPIEQILDQFSVSVGKNVKISQLLKDINTTLDGVSEDISQFSLGKDTFNQMTEALQVMNLLESVIEASKVDEGDMNNIYGYTKTLNEVNHKIGNQKWIDLMEVKSGTANVLQQDLRILKNKMNFLRNLYALNSGQKLSEQRRVSLNKDYLFYNRLSSFVACLPDDDDDWKGVSELRRSLEALDILRDNASKRQLTVSADVQGKIDEQVMKMEDAIYDFFKQNKGSLKSSKKIAKLLKGNLNLYEVPNSILTSESNVMDDNSFIWWLVTRAAVRSTDFHKEYSAILDGSIAPIPTQEIATYENYASIVNKDMFTRFYRGFRQAIKEDWESKTVDERKNIIRKQNENFDDDHKFSFESAGEDQFKDYPFVNLITPRYSSIVFTEGIPGSGKKFIFFYSWF